MGGSGAGSSKDRRALRARLRRWLLAGIGGLYALSVPWYRTAADSSSIVLGLPDWVAVAVGCYVAIAALNAVAWTLTDVPDDLEPGDAERQ